MYKSNYKIETIYDISLMNKNSVFKLYHLLNTDVYRGKLSVLPTLNSMFILDQSQFGYFFKKQGVIHLNYMNNKSSMMSGIVI